MQDYKDSAIRRGEIYSANLDPVMGSEQGGIRPVVIVQNDVGNRFSPTVIVLAITSQTQKARLPTHVPVAGGLSGLSKPSVVLAEQIRTLEKMRLSRKMGELTPYEMAQIDLAMQTSLGFRA